MVRLVQGIRRKVKSLLYGDNWPSLIKWYFPKGLKRAVHVSTFSFNNVGDIVLSAVLRDLFNDNIGVSRWIHRPVNKVVDDADVQLYNNQDFVVIGGGGLLLKDTNANDLSGWQWPCSIEKLQGIEVPLIMFAVGYNRFRGQDDFAPVFYDYINEFVKKAAFVGIRNHGSINMLRPYLRTKELQEKLVFQPCMTTLLAHIYPKLLDYQKKEDYIALNVAFDRQVYRGNNDGILQSIASVISVLSKLTKIKYYSHLRSDDNMLPYLDKCNVPYELVKLSSPYEIIKAYSSPRLVIGMRGHAQMIPFGCYTPILSIVSHDKLKWFLDDIGHPEWGIDVRDNNFEQALLEKALYGFHNTKKLVDEIIIQQQSLWETTKENFRTIKKNLN